MNSTAQLNFSFATNEQVKKTWAFAVLPGRTHARSRRPASKAQIYRSVITACSREAQRLGVHVGMRYDEALQKVPNMRILVIGTRRQA